MSLRIDLTDRHEHHNEDVKQYAREKVERLTRYFDKVQHIEVVFDKENSDHSVEIIVSANHHLRFVGHATHPSVMAAIDRVMEKLEKQVVKAKERMKDHHRGDSPLHRAS